MVLDTRMGFGTIISPFLDVALEAKLVISYFFTSSSFEGRGGDVGLSLDTCS